MSDFDFNEATTTELLALPVCKQIAATFAGMENLSAFDSVPGKLENLVEVMEAATEVPPALSAYSLDHVHHAAEMLRWCVLKDQASYDGVMFDIFGDYFDDASGD